MHSDVFLETGYSHMVCEDYILNNESAIVLSDGCSSSPNTDVGARILSHVAMDMIKNEIEFNADVLINKVTKITSDFPGILEEALDCTLSMCYIKNDLVHIKMYSDGVFFFKEKGGDLEIGIVSFSCNTPFYLNYKRNPFRLGSFRTKNIRKVISNYSKDTEWLEWFVTTSLLKPENEVFLTIPTKNIEFVGIASDGIESFDSSMYVEKIVEELAKFKTTAGEFVKRRAKRFTKENKHYDDLSIGVIML